MGIPLFNSNSVPQRASAAMCLGLQGLYEISDTQKLDLGSRIRLVDGREFVYGRAGASELAPGKINQTAIADQEDQAVTVTAAIGNQYITFTTDSATITANQYAGGFIYANDDAGEPQIYTIKSHGASTTTGPATFYTYETIRTAITAGAGTVSAIKHPCDGLIVCPTTLTGAPAGVALVTVTAAYYAWFQVKGPCPVLTDGTLVVGNNAIVSNGVAGAVEPSGSDVLPVIGVVLQVQANTEYSLINLDIPGY